MPRLSAVGISGLQAGEDVNSFQVVPASVPQRMRLWLGSQGGIRELDVNSARRLVLVWYPAQKGF